MDDYIIYSEIGTGSDSVVYKGRRSVRYPCTTSPMRSSEIVFSSHQHIFHSRHKCVWVCVLVTVSNIVSPLARTPSCSPHFVLQFEFSFLLLSSMPLTSVTTLHCHEQRMCVNETKGCSCTVAREHTAVPLHPYHALIRPTTQHCVRTFAHPIRGRSSIWRCSRSQTMLMRRPLQSLRMRRCWTTQTWPR